MKYPFGAISSSDPSKLPLGFKTREEAEKHCIMMNNSRETFDDGSWNKDFWKVKPEPWIIIES